MKPGNTPLVELGRFAPSGTRLFAKLEWFNPTGSIKDRAAWFMFHNAVQNGRLVPGQPLIETIRWSSACRVLQPRNERSCFGPTERN